MPLSGPESLIGLDRAAIGEKLRALDIPEREIRMRVAQIWHWVYARGAETFAAMTTIAKPLRERLEASASLSRPELIREEIARDGTRKWLLRLPRDPARDRHVGGRGAEVECVYIPEADRGTLCVSSQVGCTLTCAFCHTGTQRLVRNLSAGEIMGQVLFARDRLGDYPGRTPPEACFVPGNGSRFVSNIVFMGMGEPLYNFEAVRDAIAILTDPEGCQFSRRRVTVSTAGVVPEIARLGREVGAMLAVSLHATNDALRDELVPINRKYPLGELLEACRTYPAASNARRITIEYVMLKGVNDSPAEARALAAALNGIDAKINLIPFNPWPGTRFECSDWATIERFSEIVFAAGYSAPIRTPRGRDILAACGQLKSETEKLSARARLLSAEPCP